MGLNLGDGRATPATTTKEELAKRAERPTHEDVGKLAERPDHLNKVIPTPGETKPGAPEGEQDVKDRLDRTQPVSGSNDVASREPDDVRRDPPTPAEERKDMLADRDLHADLERSAGLTPAEDRKQPKSTADDGIVRYSSHPILKYKIGKFKFENGLLELTEQKDVDEFEALLKDLPRSESIRLKKLDLSAAEAMVRKVQESGPRATKAIGSETGDRQPNNQKGSGRLEDLNS